MTYLGNLGFNNLASRRYEQPEADTEGRVDSHHSRINNLYSYHVKTTEGADASYHCHLYILNGLFI